MASPPDGNNNNSPAVARAREIVMRYGWNAVAYQILNPGFRLWFSRDTEAVTGYVKRDRRWIVAGAPICSRESLPRVIEQLESDAHADGCEICYFGAARRLYEGCKNPPRHSVIALGAQPTWDPAHWHNMIQHRASVRAQLNRARNKGVSAEECCSPDAIRVNEMQTLLDAWIQHRRMPPMHFLVEPETLNRLEDRRVFLARQGTQLVGFLVASPIPAQNGWLVEQIIRHPTAPNGTNELLVHQAMTTFAGESTNYVTLGLVPLSSHLPADAPRNPAWLRLLFAWIRAHGRRFYNFQGLEAFKSKFRPDQWEPIYAIATEPRFTSKTLWAIAAAFSHKRSPIIHGAQALTMAVREEVKRVRD